MPEAEFDAAKAVEKASAYLPDILASAEALRMKDPLRVSSLLQRVEFLEAESERLRATIARVQEVAQCSMHDFEREFVGDCVACCIAFDVRVAVRALEQPGAGVL